MADKCIAGAIKRPGALKRKAKAADMSTIAYARQHRQDKGRTGQQSRMMMTMRGMHK